MKRLTMPRAWRPVKAPALRRVGASDARERRPVRRGDVPASGQRMKAVPSCAACAPAAQDRRQRAARGDRARGDERQVDVRADELQQRQQAVLAGALGVDERGAVPARLDALHDQGVGAGRGGALRPRRRRSP